MTSRASKFLLYESAVQTPASHARWFGDLYWSIHRREPRLLREDFCGTFAISRQWVKSNPNHSALALDLDPKPLAFGKSQALKELSPSSRKRLRASRSDVKKVTRPRADLIVACNFSVNIFKKEQELERYFRAARKSLAKGGLFVLEISGGPSMIHIGKESKRVFHPGKRSRKKAHWFKYIWEQKSFDPISHEARYAIHFQFPDGGMISNAFTYDWRLWTIPELRHALRRAGFSSSRVYWEESDEAGRGSGVYVHAERGENDYMWISYVVGVL